MRAAGAEQVFAEKISGAVTDRKALARTMVALGSEDVLLITLFCSEVLRNALCGNSANSQWLRENEQSNHLGY